MKRYSVKQANMEKRAVLPSVATILIAAAIVIGATGAFFSDAETSSGNTFAAGVIDLMVDNESYYNGQLSDATTWLDPRDLDEGTLFFNFTDLKPDDEGEDTISLHVGTNAAWACMDVTLTSNDDTSSNEPELVAGDELEDDGDEWDGELAQHLDFVWWADDGDNVLEDDELIITPSGGVETLYELAHPDAPFSVALADSANNIWSGAENDPLEPDVVQYVAKGWCFGTLTLDPLAQDDGDQGRSPIDEDGPGMSCDGEWIGNALQTDGATLDVSFRTMQARHNPEFLCTDEPIDIVMCEDPQLSYADDVVFVDQGLRNDGSPVLAARSDTSKALGAPQSTGTPYDDTGNPAILNGFFSLGFPSEDPLHTAEIVLSFDDNYVIDGPDEDLKLWEVTGGTSYPDELVDVYVGNNPGGPWTPVGLGVTRDAEIDIAPVVAARYVRIVDASDPNDFEPTADGYDLDAVQALNCAVSPIQ